MTSFYHVFDNHLYIKIWWLSCIETIDYFSSPSQYSSTTLQYIDYIEEYMNKEANETNDDANEVEDEEESDTE